MYKLACQQTFVLVVILIMMALRDLGAGRNWGKCSRTNGSYRENLAVRDSDCLVLVAVEHRGKAIFKLLLCKNWGIN